MPFEPPVTSTRAPEKSNVAATTPAPSDRTAAERYMASAPRSSPSDVLGRRRGGDAVEDGRLEGGDLALVALEVAALAHHRAPGIGPVVELDPPERRR